MRAALPFGATDVLLRGSEECCCFMDPLFVALDSHSPRPSLLGSPFLPLVLIFLYYLEPACQEKGRREECTREGKEREIKSRHRSFRSNVSVREFSFKANSEGKNKW